MPQFEDIHQLFDIDLRNGRIYLKEETKKEKERVVYVAEDLLALVTDTVEANKRCLGAEPSWLFPGYRPEKHISIHTVDKRFNTAWSGTPFAESCGKKPAVHSLRHTFVVKRMNLWMEQGIDLNRMLPYLSRFLGHMSFHETYYYYGKQNIMVSKLATPPKILAPPPELLYIIVIPDL